MLNFDTLAALVRAYTEKEGNPFYRRRYGVPDTQSHLAISSLEEWRRLPPLRKEEMIAASFEDRLFVPRAQLQTVSVTSGTTGGPPLFQPRSFQGPRIDTLLVNSTDVAGDTVRPNAPRAWLSGILQYPHEHEWGLAQLGHPSTVVQFDPQRVSESVRLALAAGVEGIVAQTYFVTALCAVAEESGLAGRIRKVVAAGEAWTRSEIARVRRTFVNAEVICDYGTREAGIIAFTGLITEDAPVVYRTMQHVYLEVIESESGEVLPLAAGVEGELLITTTLGEPSAFPLLRYRSGDMVKIESEQAGDGSFSFTLLGRAGHDFVKLPGGLLRVDELDRVAHLLREYMSDQFEAHCYEEESPKGSVKRVVLHVEATAGTDLSVLAERIAAELHLGPSTTYASAVAHGRCLPLQCIPLEVKEGGPKKRKRVVKHW